MPRKLNRAAQGSGTIRQRKDGKWEARYTVGRDLGTGKQIQKSVYGKTQAECGKKLREATTVIDNGTYSEPSKMTLGQWLDIWLREFTGNVKEDTYATYEAQIRVNIKPALGAVKLSELKPHQIQAFYNDLLRREAKTLQPQDAQEPKKPRKPIKSLKPKTIKNTHGVLHRALDQAVMLGYIAKSPCFGVKLPRIEEPEMHPFTESDMSAFFASIAGSEYEALFKVDLFTGLRQGEIMALTWDRINFANGTIYVDRQLIREKKRGGLFKYAPPKNDKPRKLTPAPSVMKMLQEQKRLQAERRLQAGSMWDDGGFPSLVFTNALGGHYVHNTLTHNFKRHAELIGVKATFHDMRHTYAVNSLRAGDDVKTVQSNLGHATAAFTLDRYAHYTEDMRRDSAARMEAFINGLKNLQRVF